jgi:signal transduction histidine kinase
MMRRLWVQLWVAFLIVALGTAAVAGTMGRLIGHEDSWRSGEAAIRVLMSNALDPEREQPIQATLDDLSRRTGVQLALWTPDARMIAAVGGPELMRFPPEPDERDVSWRAMRGGPRWQVRLDDGRWLVARPKEAPRHGVALTVMLAALGVTAVGCYAIARRVTRRLELLETGVERFGSGDLTARATVDGHDELARVADRFNQAAGRIQVLVDGQRRMLASASHELRSPLARIRMALALLEDDDEARQRLTRGAEADVDELDRLVGDLLLSGRLEGGGLRLERVDLGALARERTSRHDIPVTGDGAVNGDRVALARVIDNLVENARRYAGGADGVTITPGDGALLLQVTDRGPGVDPALRERIFEPFFRPPDHDEGRDGGVGLGLALVRNIARAHGGEAWWEPRAGGGSCFCVRLATGA